MSMTTNKEMLACNADACYFILLLILNLFYLYTNSADNDAVLNTHNCQAMILKNAANP